MALHKDFPKSPHEILVPSVRWFPADEALRKEGYEIKVNFNFVSRLELADTFRERLFCVAEKLR